MPCRRLAIAVVSATLAVALTACTPEPAATPTPTGFASEEEAFAAAEETYRAYVDALNARNAGDENADPMSFLIGEASSAEAEAENFLENAGYHISGTTEVTSFTPVDQSTIDNAVAITALVCLDSSDSRVLDKNNNEVTIDGQLVEYALDVTLISSDTRTLAISQSEISEGASCD